MKTRRFDFNFRPLQVDVSVSVLDSVPDKQNYDAEANEYTPDYTVTPLTIQPRVSIMDKDEIQVPGNVNAALVNVRWYEIVNGVSTLIDTANTGYQVTTTGPNAGRIQVKKNASTGAPITLQLYAEYVDNRTGQVHVIQATHAVKCSNATIHTPELLLDAASQTIYNPLTDPETQAIHASLRIGATECPANMRRFVWEIYRDTNTWTEFGADATLDYFATVSSDTTTLTLNRQLMGENVFIRCRAKYDRGGNPAGVTLTDASPECIISVTRRLPKYECDITELPVNLPSGLLAINPTAKVWDTNGTVPNATNELLPLWYIATNKTSGTLSYSQVGHGVSPTLPTKAISNSLGGVVGLDLVDTGPLACWEDSDGALFEDGDGNLILIK